MLVRLYFYSALTLTVAGWPVHCSKALDSDFCCHLEWCATSSTSSPVLWLPEDMLLRPYISSIPVLNTVIVLTYFFDFTLWCSVFSIVLFLLRVGTIGNGVLHDGRIGKDGSHLRNISYSACAGTASSMSVVLCCVMSELHYNYSARKCIFVELFGLKLIIVGYQWGIHA